MKDKKVEEFQTRAFCPQCGSNIYAPFGSTFHVTGTIGAVCPKCGYQVDSRWGDHFHVHTVRKVQNINPDRKWWNPFSKWLPGYWEDVDGNRVGYKDGNRIKYIGRESIIE